MGCSITAVLESQWIWFTLWKKWPKVYREAIYEAGLISTISLHWCLIKVTGGFISWKMSFGFSASGSVFVAPTFARLFSGIEREEKKSLIFWKFEFQLVFVSIKEKKLFLLFFIPGDIFLKLFFTASNFSLSSRSAQTCSFPPTGFF